MAIYVCYKCEKEEEIRDSLHPCIQSKKKKKNKIKKTPKIKKIPSPNMCRICNDEPGEIPIFNNFIQPEIPEEIQNFSGITLNNSDNLSKHMCQSCLDLLNGCIIFREMCQRTNRQLIEISIKQEYTQDCQNYEKDNDANDTKADSEDSYNIPSPEFSMDTSELLSLWGCSTCGEEFHVMASYSRHINKCNAQSTDAPKPPEEITKRKFLCDICGKTAYSNASLLVHKAIHENVFPFKCDVCPYQGRTMDLLKVHKRSHLVDKPFKCTQCPKATTTSSNLAKHMRHVHSTMRPFKCSYCDKAFSYQHDMNRHIKDIHLRQGTVECDICYKKFNTKKILQGHRWKIHKIKGERQGRLPSYLQHQGVVGPRPNNENNVDANTNNCNHNLKFVDSSN